MRSAILALCLASAQVACAEDIPPGGSGLDAEAALVSDYRYRGVSYTRGKPALQGGVELSAESGWFGGIWASATLARVPGTGEIDFYAGREGEIVGLAYVVGAYAYFDVGLSALQYVELQTTFSRDVGPLAVETEVSVVPKQGGDPTNLYLGVTARVPLAVEGAALVVHGGYEDGFFRRKVDWGAGAEYRLAGFTLRASALGSTARDDAEAARAPTRGGTALVFAVSRRLMR